MIFVECNTERVLLRCLGIPKRETRHVGGKLKVCKMLERIPSSKALIDEDPWSHQPPYLRRLKQVGEEAGIRRLLDERTSSEVLMLCPRFEEWIIETARDAGIDLAKCNLPADGGQLHKFVNLHPQRLEKLVSELLSRSERLKKLRELLRC